IAENVEDFMVSYELKYGKGTPLAGVEVIANRGAKQFRGVTDEKGAYRIAVPEPGKYTVVAKADGYASSTSEYQVAGEADSCAETNIGMWTDSRISGSVYSLEGKPVQGIAVQLICAACTDRGPFQTVRTSAEGAYEFQKVPPGEYAVGVNVTGLKSAMPYLTR